MEQLDEWTTSSAMASEILRLKEELAECKIDCARYATMNCTASRKLHDNPNNQECPAVDWWKKALFNEKLNIENWWQKRLNESENNRKELKKVLKEILFRINFSNFAPEYMWLEDKAIELVNKE